MGLPRRELPERRLWRCFRSSQCHNVRSGGDNVLNLLLAIFWLCTAIGLLYAYFTGKQVFRISESGLEMLALLALLLAAYNLVRWWALRASARARDMRS